MTEERKTKKTLPSIPITPIPDEGVKSRLVNLENLASFKSYYDIWEANLHDILQNNIEVEEQSRRERDLQILAKIGSKDEIDNFGQTVITAITGEISRATNKEEELANAISAETNSRIAVVNEEKERAKAAEKTLTDDLATEIENRMTAVTDLDTKTTNRSNEVETNAKKINLVEGSNNDGKLAFTNYDGTTTEVQGGFLPDGTLLELNSNQITANPVNIAGAVSIASDEVTEESFETENNESYLLCPVVIKDGKLYVKLPLSTFEDSAQ